MQNEALNKEYRDAFVVSSDRARHVLAILVFASIVVFGAAWNSRPTAWPLARLDCVYLGLAHRENPEEIDESRRARAKSCSDMLPKDNTRAEELRSELLKRVLAMYVVKVPVLGLELDINDLGLLSGLSFAVLLLWLRFCLSHELANLRRVIAATPSESANDVYRLLSMRQVLTDPPPLSGARPAAKIWTGAVRLLFAVPLLVQVALFSGDLMSLSEGWELNRMGTSIHMVLSGISLIASGALVWINLRLSARIGKTWGSYAHEARKGAAG